MDACQYAVTRGSYFIFCKLYPLFASRTMDTIAQCQTFLARLGARSSAHAEQPTDDVHLA